MLHFRTPVLSASSDFLLRPRPGANKPWHDLRWVGVVSSMRYKPVQVAKGCVHVLAEYHRQGRDRDLTTTVRQFVLFPPAMWWFLESCVGDAVAFSKWSNDHDPPLCNRCNLSEKTRWRTLELIGILLQPDNMRAIAPITPTALLEMYFEGCIPGWCGSIPSRSTQGTFLTTNARKHYAELLRSKRFHSVSLFQTIIICSCLRVGTTKTMFNSYVAKTNLLFQIFYHWKHSCYATYFMRFIYFIKSA